MIPLYRVDYKGFALIEADSTEEALENLRQYGAEYDEEEITEVSEIDLDEKVRLISTVCYDIEKILHKTDNSNDEHLRYQRS